VTLAKGLRYHVVDVFYPDTAVRRLQIDDRRLNDRQVRQEFTEAAIIAILWVVFLAVGVFVLLLALPGGEYTLENVVFEVASAQGNVGLSAGITGPESLPDVAKVGFLFNMWIGRLEIVPVLVTLRVVFARGGLYA